MKLLGISSFALALVLALPLAASAAPAGAGAGPAHPNCVDDMSAEHETWADCHRPGTSEYGEHGGSDGNISFGSAPNADSCVADLKTNNNKCVGMKGQAYQRCKTEAQTIYVQCVFDKAAKNSGLFDNKNN